MRRRKPAPPLPRPCQFCAPNDGRWMRNVNGGLQPCDCERGRAIMARSPAGKRAAAKASGPKPYDPAIHGAGAEE